MNEFHFRKAHIEDAEQLAALAYQLNLYHKDDTKPSAKEFRENWNQFEAFVIENSAKDIVAFLSGYESYQFHTATRRFEMQNIFVSESCRNQGVGHSLVKQVISIKWRDGIQKFSLGVAIKNETARSFYASLGFKDRPQDYVRCILDGDDLVRLLKVD